MTNGKPNGMQFVPHQPEELVVVRITKKEAIALSKIRKFAFGEITVIKANGVILDIVSNQRQRIDGTEKIELDIV